VTSTLNTSNTAVSSQSTAPETVAAAPRSVTSAPFSQPAAQYRPGGTSSYVGPVGETHVEIATRPASPATTTPSGQSQPTTTPSTGIRAF
jgi:hypothetical protein